MSGTSKPVAGRKVVVWMIAVVLVVSVGFVLAVTLNIDTIRRIAEQRNRIIDPYDVPARDVSSFRKATGKADDGAKVSKDEASAFCAWANKRLNTYNEQTGGFRCETDWKAPKSQ